MKRYLVTHNVCGEKNVDLVEVEYGTLEEFVNWIIESIDAYFIILTGVSEDIKVKIAIKPKNIESVAAFND